MAAMSSLRRFFPQFRKPGLPAPWLSLASAVILLMSGANVHAQSMDYGALEQLFGEPVTTAATGTPQRVSDSPANMTIITADDIRRSGSRSIPEILSRIPGLDILRSGLSAYDIGMRGYQQPMQPRLLVLIDGRQVFLDDYSRTDWSNLPVNIDDIRQIEVVVGAASALFGSNAASGVINIVTNSPIYDNSNVAHLEFGTQQQVTGDATMTVKRNWGGVKVSAGGLTADEFRTPRYPNDGNVMSYNPSGIERPKHEYAAISSVLQITPSLQANAELSYTRSISNFADATDFNVIGVQHDKSYSVRGGFAWAGPYGLVTGNTYLNHTFVNFFETADGGQPFGTKMNLIVSQLQDQFKLGANHTLRIALEYRHRTYTQYNEEAIPQNPLLVQNFYAASGTWLWRVNEKISFSSAVRFEHEAMAQEGQINTTGISSYEQYDHSLSAVSANVALLYNPTSVDHFRLGYGRGTMFPSLIQNGYSQISYFGGSQLFDIEGNPKLKPTIVEDYSADYTRKIDGLFSTLKLSAFFEHSSNLVAPFINIDGPGVIIDGIPAVADSAQNVGNSHGWGGEIQLKGSHPSGFRWDASYSYARVTDESDMVKTLLNYEGSAPRHHLRLILGYSTGRWEFDENTQYVSGTNLLRDTGNYNVIPIHTRGYLSVSGRIGYRVNDFYTIALSGTNLNRHITQVSPYPAVERQVMASVTAKF